MPVPPTSSDRAIARKPDEAVEVFTIGVGRGGDESSSLDTALSLDGIKANEFERDMFEDG